MAVNPTQLELLRKLLRHGGSMERVVRMLEKLRPAEIADCFGNLAPNELKVMLDVLVEHGDLAVILPEVSSGLLEEDVLPMLNDERLAGALDRAAPDDAHYLITLLDEARIGPVLKRLKPSQRERIRRLLNYPPESAGSLMTNQMVTLRAEVTIQEAIDTIRAQVVASEFIFYIYVVNEAGTFLGVVPIRRLIMGGPEQPLSDVMVVNPVAVFVTSDQEEVAAVTARYDLLAVPVVDENFKLLGVITVDDVIDVLQDEATEDMYLMQGLSDEDRVYSPVSKSVRMRVPWTLLNLLTASAAASVIGIFEDSIAQATVLAAFMPMVAGMGGNGGTQTLTVVTRGLAIGEVNPLDGGRSAVKKQCAIGLINGAWLGLLTGFAAWIWKGSLALSAVLFMAMVFNLTLAGFVGSMVPLVLKALNQDPALGGGVIVTACTDTFGFLIFLGLATALLPYIIG